MTKKITGVAPKCASRIELITTEKREKEVKEQISKMFKVK